jgi:hypothetical protein
MATKKDVLIEDNVETVETEVQESPTTKPAAKATKAANTARKFAPDDLILCRSVFPGLLLFTGPKTKNTYTFYAKGDDCYVEYQDLLSAMLTKKRAITAPDIIIEDEELLEDVHWRDVKKTYEKLNKVGDINKLINLPYREFEKQFNILPIGTKKNIMLTVAALVREGEFDSMNKIEVIDKACGSNLAVLLQR